jgi:hypothetical protein
MEVWNEVWQDRFKEALRDAGRDRLVLHDLALQAKRDRTHRRVMAWLGRGLIAWGWRLQEHFSGRVEARATK